MLSGTQTSRRPLVFARGIRPAVVADCRGHNEPEDVVKQSEAARKISAWYAALQPPTPSLSSDAARYRRTLGSGRTPLRSDGNLQAQVAHYEAAQVHQSHIVAVTRQLLCAASVPPMLFAYYFCFARQVDRLVRRFAGSAVRDKAPGLIDRWGQQGLSRPVLITICRQVFNVTLVGQTTETGGAANG